MDGPLNRVLFRLQKYSAVRSEYVLMDVRAKIVYLYILCYESSI